jgi:TetR/AcrR family transcriptional regulator, fatty acid metabolism regulator protein
MSTLAQQRRWKPFAGNSSDQSAPQPIDTTLPDLLSFYKPTRRSVFEGMRQLVREQRRGEARKERILEAALGVFSRRGYRDAAMDEIAGESDTSKGGVYFHFPNKQTIFLALLDRMSNLLIKRAETAISAEPDPIKRIDAALLVVLKTFGDHRSLARLFLVEAMGAGREFNDKMLEIRRNFAGLITKHLDDAVAEGAIPPLDTNLAGIAWFGALNEVVTHWVLSDTPEPIEQQHPALRDLLRRSIGVPANVLITDESVRDENS